MGLTADISRGGIMLATTEILPDKSQVVLVVGIQNNTFTLQGRVIWSKNPFNELGADISCGSGISLDDPPLEYLDYVEQLLSELL